MQAATAAHVSHRLHKARALPEPATWLKAGGAFEVWGWQKHYTRWQVRRVAVNPTDLAMVELTARARKRKRPAQAGLFD